MKFLETKIVSEHKSFFVGRQNHIRTMKITVTTVTDYVFELDVSEELELENFKAFCEVESGFPSTEIVIMFKGQPLLDDKKSLKDHGVGDGDVVLLQHAMQAASLLSSAAANRTSNRNNANNR